MRIFITGGTGLVGNRLLKRLIERGYRPVLLTRRAEQARKQVPSAVEIVEGNPTEGGPWMDVAQSCDGVVNLVGEGIFNKRWNDEFKEELRKSRIVSTHNVVTAMSKSPKRADGVAKALVSASAIGIYGPHGDEELNESSPSAADFLGQLCVDWEKATLAAALHGIRAVCVRVGVVLDPNGGALAKMLPPFKMFVGGPIGSGRQYMSWIHHEDLVGIILLALDRANVSGPVNGTAPVPVTNKEFSKALGRVLGRPSFMPTPGFMLRLMLGGVAGVITQGQRVLPRKAQDSGYEFKYNNIDAALTNLLAAPTAT